MRTAIVNGKVFTGEKIIDNVIIVIENGRVCAMEDSIPGDARVINLEGWNIGPGFIDIQINGGSKHYFFKGISLVTHLYNAMTQIGHREPGIVGAVFDNEDVFAPVILDGAHCHYAAARIAYKLKREKLFLITDSSFLGRKLKEFEWEFIDAKLIDGFYRNKEGNLAGASISMVEAVQNAIQYLNVTVEEAVSMATLRVAKAIKMDHNLGAIKVGYPASFIKFSNDFKQYETMIF